MKLYEYQRSMPFIDLVQGHLDSTFSNFFSLKTAGPIEAKFHMKPPYDGGMKVSLNSPGYMTNMAAISIYGNNLTKSSSLEPKGRWPWRLVCSIGYSSTTKFVQMLTLGWPWPILRSYQIWSIMLLYGKNNTMDFSETIVVCDIKVGRCSQLNEYMNLYELPKVKIIQWPSSKVTQIQHFQTSFP